MASFSVYQQPDETWSWKVLGEGQRFIMCVNPGYPTACAAAEGAIPMLGGELQKLAVKLAASFTRRSP